MVSFDVGDCRPALGVIKRLSWLKLHAKRPSVSGAECRHLKARCKVFGVEWHILQIQVKSDKELKQQEGN